MTTLILIIILCVIFILLVRYINRLAAYSEITEPPFRFYDNSHIRVIVPQENIEIEGNEHECHKILTPCRTHSDCDLCREGLANCQYFEEETILPVVIEGEQYEYNIQPGESFCLALDRHRARQCNPNTGRWLLAQTERGFALLCNCMYPGLVTQLNLYEDCNISVGCQPNGVIQNINTYPFQCECNEGFIAEYDEDTNVPYCRPRLVRDVMHNEQFFHRAPCRDGYVVISHPALHDDYRRVFILPDICVPDPCQTDPITGERVVGQLYHAVDGDNEYKLCRCSDHHNAFPVYTGPDSMIDSIYNFEGYSGNMVTNACLSPFNVIYTTLPKVDYRIFWARSNLLSDDEIVAYPLEFQVKQQYRVMLYQPLTPHPDLINFNGNYRVMKLTLAYNPPRIAPLNVFDLYHAFLHYQGVQSPTNSCMKHGLGRCVLDTCILPRRIAVVNLHEFFRGDRCYFGRRGSRVTVFRWADHYNLNYPAVFRVDVRFRSNQQNRYLTADFGSNMVENEDRITFRNVLETYNFYSQH